jgi:hypothetical protein
MYRPAFGCVLLLALAAVSGCRKSASAGTDAAPAKQTHESVLMAAMQSLQNTAASLNRIGDASSADQAVAEVTREAESLQRHAQQLAALGPPSPTERNNVMRHNNEMMAAIQGVTQAMAKVSTAIQSRQFPPATTERPAAAAKLYGNAMTAFGQQLQKVTG